MLIFYNNIVDLLRIMQYNVIDKENKRLEKKMTSYKELFLKSQAIIADAIENLEIISYELKKCMQECENEVISEESKIIEINNKGDS